jgi:hypothetical protein
MQPQELYTQHFIFFVTYEWAKQARLFVPGRLFQHGLMFGSKAKSLRLDHLKGASQG